MASLKLLYSVPISNLQARFNIPQGLWSGLFITFDGENNASQTFTNALLGTLITKVNGNEKDNVYLPDLYAANNVIEGVNESSTTQNSSFRHTVKLPFFNYMGSRPDYGNAWLVRPKDTMEVEHQFPGATATIIESGTVTYWGIQADAAQRCLYETRFKNYDQSPGAAGSPVYNLEMENVAALFIENDTALTSLTIKKDDVVVLDNANRDELYAYTQQRNNVKTFATTTTPIVLNFNESGLPEGCQNRRVQFIPTVSGAATIKVLALQLFATPKRLQESDEIARARIQAMANAKAEQGIVGAADYLNAQSK